MNESDAEKVLKLAHSVCRQLGELSDTYRQHESPASKKHVRFCGDGISYLLNDIMVHLLVEHPHLDDKLFDGRFDAKNFVVYPDPGP